MEWTLERGQLVSRQERAKRLGQAVPSIPLAAQGGKGDSLAVCVMLEAVPRPRGEQHEGKAVNTARPGLAVDEVACVDIAFDLFARLAR